MEPKIFKLLSCIFLLFSLNPFLNFSHANSSHQSHDKRNSSTLDFLTPLIGTRKGNTTIGAGLSQLKKYLTKFGYLSRINPDHPSRDNNYDDLFDHDNLELAIKKYQQYFKLKITGFLDSNTIAQLQKPPCGVPDFPTRNITSKYSFFPKEQKWPPSKRNLTYSFPSGTRIDLHYAILTATRLWASISPFKFTYITDYNKADIKISFQRGDHGDGYPFDGSGRALAHGFAPPDGRLHLDVDDQWWNGVKQDAYDMHTVGLHELGHVLGLGHSTDPKAIMWPSLAHGLRKGLGRDDIDGLRALYKF